MDDLILCTPVKKSHIAKLEDLLKWISGITKKKCQLFRKELVAKPTLQDRKVCRNASCMFGHPLCLDALHMFGCPIYLDTPTYIWMPLYVLMIFGCPLCIHNTKKACFVRLRGVSISSNTFRCPHMFGWPQYVWTPPHMFGCPLYVWISPICLYTPICLDALCMFG